MKYIGGRILDQIDFCHMKTTCELNRCRHLRTALLIDRVKQELVIANLQSRTKYITVSWSWHIKDNVYFGDKIHAKSYNEIVARAAIDMQDGVCVCVPYMCIGLLSKQAIRSKGNCVLRTNTKI